MQDAGAGRGGQAAEPGLQGDAGQGDLLPARRPPDPPLQRNLPPHRRVFHEEAPQPGEQSGGEYFKWHITLHYFF